MLASSGRKVPTNRWHPFTGARHDRECDISRAGLRTLSLTRTALIFGSALPFLLRHDWALLAVVYSLSNAFIFEDMLVSRRSFTICQES